MQFPESKISNPIIPGFHPDPSICRAGEDYYLVTSSFEYFPGVPIFHSRNLINWNQIGHCLTRDTQLPLEGVGVSGGIFAPTLRFHAGRFYLVTTNLTNGGHFYVWTKDPYGSWSEPIWIEADGIDPDLFWNKDGRVYFSSTGKGNSQIILQREIDLGSGKLISEPIQVDAMIGGKYPEAPHVYIKDGTYYLMIAEGGTEYGHCVTIARGPSPMGPWEKCPHNPILTHRSTGSPIQATGHADLVEDHNGHWWLLCLGIRPKGIFNFHILGRETFLAPVRWVDGWPIIGLDGKIAMEMKGHPGLPESQLQSWSSYDDFSKGSLPVYWNFIGNPDTSLWGLESGQLVLSCAAPNLDAREGQAWIGRRQQHFDFTVTASLDFQASNEQEESGLTIYQNNHHHYEIAITQRDGSHALIVRRRIGKLSSIVALEQINQSTIELAIQGDPTHYRLGFVKKNREYTWLETAETRYLSTEVSGGFTGVYIAMYATANGNPSEEKAHFNHFSYSSNSSTLL